MNGLLRLRCAAYGGETRVVDSYAHAPFHYLPPTRRADGLPLLTVVNSSGGVLGGDALELSVDLGPHAALAVRPQAATKIYRTAQGPARSRSRFTLAAGALLDYNADAIIPFAGSDFTQTTEIELAAGARAVLAEIVTAGRLARDERFAFTRLVLDVQCFAGGALLLRDRADLQPARRRLDAPAILDTATVWASLYVLATAPLSAAFIDAVDARLRAVRGGAGGATAAPAGLLGRVVGTSLDAVGDAVTAARVLALERLVPV